ncbi:adventurous gliding motility TPR repeat lipoprotein GltE [Vulgatibacter incomptus]|uniref:TPR repeat protein n=1 Tax=Vulgatibacter incomptus TaxID=1391653 RepID=A0A0K1PDW4_9BACT|nr:adventurous gliding motility TPR repeat lipoprotein GltE [Vulgatibacter incomptus]AKU91309.1 TPR repeat protein [Vulgatibacter incomptus]
MIREEAASKASLARRPGGGSAARLAATILAAAALLGTGACSTTSGSKAGVGDGLAKGGEERSPAAKRKFDDAVRAYDEGKTLKVVDWDLLARKFEAVLDEDDTLAEAHFNLGVIDERRGKPDAAKKRYAAALEAKPSLFVARENLGLLLERGGDPQAAAEQYKAILRVYPEHAGARARLASLFLAAGDLERARELAREALLRDPKNLTAQKVLVRVHTERGQLDVARLIARRAAELDATDPEMPWLMGQLLEKKGEKERALAQYRRALEVQADFLPARARLASDSLERRSYQEAAVLYEGIVQAEPKNAAAQLDLGTALYGSGKIDEALAAFTKAQELDSNDARPAFSIAVILHRSKDQPEEALAFYRRFISGSAVNLPGGHPVFGLMRECEQLVHLKAEMKAAEEEARAGAEAEAKATVQEAVSGASANGAAEERSAPAPAPVVEKRQAEPARASQANSAAPAVRADVDPDEPEDDF